MGTLEKRQETSGNEVDLGTRSTRRVQASPAIKKDTGSGEKN